MTGITLLNSESKRRCGECTLCCRLLPVPPLKKGANVKCQHQRTSKGCLIYDKRPLSCFAFSCKWLLEDDTADLSRPDRSHYVLDPMPDYIVVTVDSSVIKVPVVQVWVDPHFPNAHRDKALRAYLERRGREGFAALIRYGSHEGFVLVPPSITGKGWVEKHANIEPDDNPHTTEEVFKVLGEERIADAARSVEFGEDRPDQADDQTGQDAR